MKKKLLCCLLGNMIKSERFLLSFSDFMRHIRLPWAIMAQIVKKVKFTLKKDSKKTKKVI